MFLDLKKYLEKEVVELDFPQVKDPSPLDKKISTLKHLIERLTHQIDSAEPSQMDLIDFWRSERKLKQAELDNLSPSKSQKGKEELIIEQPTGTDGNYELFSVLVHSGSSSGGHYYAYIKSFEKGKWFNFNDGNVNEITEEEIKNTFGDLGASSSYSRFGMTFFKTIAN